MRAFSKGFWVFRGIFLALVLYSAFMGRLDVALINGIVFFVSLVIPALGKKYEPLDKYVCILFSLFIVVVFTPLEASDGGPLGIDKLFHAAAGFWLAWLIVTYDRNGVQTFTRPRLALIVLAVGLGAGWEIFEWILWQLPAHVRVLNHGLSDTMLDLVADAVGATVFAHRDKLLKPFRR